MQLPADEGLSMVVYNAELGSPEADALKLLASWGAGEDAVRAAPAGTV